MFPRNFSVAQRAASAKAWPTMTSAITVRSVIVPKPQRRLAALGPEMDVCSGAEGSSLGPAPRGFTSAVSYSPLPGIPIVRRTCPLVLTLTRAPGPPKEAARPFVVAVIRKGPIFRDCRNLHAIIPPYTRLPSLKNATGSRPCQCPTWGVCVSMLFPVLHHRRPSVGAPASTDQNELSAWFYPRTSHPPTQAIIMG